MVFISDKIITLITCDFLAYEINEISLVELLIGFLLQHTYLFFPHDEYRNINSMTHRIYRGSKNQILNQVMTMCAHYQ